MTGARKTILFSTDLTARCDRPLDRACKIGTQRTGGFRANTIGSMARSLIAYIPSDMFAVRFKPD